MVKPDRQEVVFDLLKELRGLDPLKQLFWSELNYERVNQSLSRRGWTDTAAQALADDPVFFAAGGHDHEFKIIYSRLSSADLRLGYERPVVSRLLRDHPYALFVFSNKAQDRWHFINVKYHLEEEKRRIFRRITIQPNEHHRTAAERIAMLDLESIQPGLYGIQPLEIQSRHDEAFDVEKIGKAFFLGYKEQFWSFVEEIKKTNKGKAHFCGEKGEENLHRLSQLILGRVLFLYFIQKKGWLNNDTVFLRSLFAPYREGKGTAFYSTCLEPLFFNGLNTAGAKKMIGNARYHIPYLNGGLFEPRGALCEGDPVKGPLVPDRSFRQLFDFLNSYNFTIAESTPLDQDVDIDPEMLGKVFENILAAEDRHSSGTYYTPRTIVEFMCRESLFHHLHEKAGIDRKAYDDLFDAPLEGRSPAITKEQALTIQSRLQEVKVLDPAVGSGAFLLGMLHELMHLRAVCGKVLGESEALQSAKHGEWKRQLIGGNIFGVDNNPEACEIARLRLWLSMVVDEAEPSPLPNLDYRIVEGDTLREKLDGEPILPPRSGPGFETEDDLFKTVKPQGKLYISERDQKTASIVRHLSAYYGTNADAEKRRLRDLVKKDLEAILEEHWQAHEERWEREKGQIAARVGQMRGKVKEVPKEWGKILIEADEHLERIRSEREMFKTEGTWPVTPLRLFFAEAFASNPGGFDIVLANPPYVRQEIIKPIKPKLKEEFGDFFSSTADLYTYFYARGLELLRPGGILCFIAPNKFMRAGYGKNTRKLLTTLAAPKVVIDFGDLPIFEATTYPSILLVEKTTVVRANGCSPVEGACHAPLQDEFLAATFTESEQIEDVSRTLSESGFPMSVKSLSENGWTLDKPEVLSLMTKIRDKGVPLGEYVKGRFYRGILTGFNEAFVIDEETKKRLIKEDRKSKEVIKPWLRGRDIKKWKAEWAGLYVIAIASSANKKWPWTDESETKAESIFEKTYPAIHRHLREKGDAFAEQTRKEKKKQQGLYKRDDQGEYWWELRSCVYYKEFGGEKIVYPDIAQSPQFCWDNDKFFAGNTVYFMPTEEKWLVGLLNSQVIWWFYTSVSSMIRGNFVRSFTQYMEMLPVFPATDKQKAPIIKRVEAILKDPASAGVAKLEREIDEEIYKLYELTDKEIEIVERQR
ncbi:MAG: Eco57I restriction-modification methylase domain-containing protein [Nitrospiraceae bacterium]|nr:Eco57I restriction-modification methylase domain-containing protein [Nitrospiraceae bacterium]